MKKSTKPFEESGMRVDVSQYPHFFFESCVVYRKLCQYYFKEMDIGWFDKEKGALYLVELKDYRTKKFMKHETHDKIIYDLFHKSLASLSMITAVQLNTRHADGIQNCLPVQISEIKQLKMIHVINSTPGKEHYLNAVKHELQRRFEAYKQLYDITTFTLLTYLQAKEYFKHIFI